MGWVQSSWTFNSLSFRVSQNTFALDRHTFTEQERKVVQGGPSAVHLRTDDVT